MRVRITCGRPRQPLLLDDVGDGGDESGGPVMTFQVVTGKVLLLTLLPTITKALK